MLGREDKEILGKMSMRVRSKLKKKEAEKVKINMKIMNKASNSK